MPEFAIKAQGVSKKFCKNLKASMFYGAVDILKGSINSVPGSMELRKDEFWAVDNVSFDVKKGETLGIIGPNGSGKSTFLKMLNGIFMPDKGKIEIDGKVGALIEVGAGFHPMLSGRENIYINGAILGMSKKEIDRKFDSIVEFADIGDFLDTPVKYYSSGMYVRLGFSVAVHCEPDILLVDEILSVGDAAFRRKSSERMSELINNSDCSIVIVSHNMQAIEAISDKVILLNKGKILAAGKTGDVIPEYEMMMRPLNKENTVLTDFFAEGNSELRLVKKYKNYSDNSIKVMKAWFESSEGDKRLEFSSNDKVSLCIFFKKDSKKIITKGGYVWVAFINEMNINCMGVRFCIGEKGQPEELPETGILRICFQPVQITTGIYKIAIHFFDHTFSVPFSTGHYGYIKVTNNIPIFTQGVNSPLCWPGCRWELNGV